jgi:hypothetical protein
VVHFLYCKVCIKISSDLNINTLFVTGIRSQSKPNDIMNEVYRAMKALDFVSMLVLKHNLVVTVSYL